MFSKSWRNLFSYYRHNISASGFLIVKIIHTITLPDQKVCYRYAVLFCVSKSLPMFISIIANTYYNSIAIFEKFFSSVCLDSHKSKKNDRG